MPKIHEGILRPRSHFPKARKVATVICKEEYTLRQAASFLVMVRAGAPHDPSLLSGTGGPLGTSAQAGAGRSWATERGVSETDGTRLVLSNPMPYKRESAIL